MRCVPSLTICLLFSLAWPATLFAQDEDYATVTEAQAQLNAEGARLAGEGEHEKAIQLFKSSLELDQLNITYLNLGRSLAKLGRCEEAVAAYDQVPTAPKVKVPTPEELKSILEGYKADLAFQCPARIVVNCNLEGITLQLDEQAPVACDGQALSVSPGSYTVLGKLGEQSMSFTVSVKGLEQADINMSFVRPPLAPEPIVIHAPDEGPGWLATGGWIATGVGATLLATSLVVDLAVLTPMYDDFQRAADAGDQRAYGSLKGTLQDGQGVNVGLMVGGGVILVAGASLLVVDLLSGGEATEEATPVTLVPWLGQGTGGLAGALRW